MRNKKVIILIILSVLAVISWIYGLGAPPKTKPVVSIKEVEKKVEGHVFIAKRSERTRYASWGRDPFVLEKTPAQEFTLNGILWDEENPLAIINNVTLGIGDAIDGSIVIEIQTDAVILNNGTENFKLRL